MSKPNLPGPPVIATLMLAAALLCCITITGPIPTKYEVLKDFQPTIAAIAVLIAATITYFAAMARVSLEEKIHREKEDSRERNLIAKVGYASLIFYAETDAVQKKVAPGVRQPPRDITLADFTLVLPDELDEAWSTLEFLPDDASKLLANVRFNIRTLQAEIRALRLVYGDEKWTVQWPTTPPELKMAIETLNDLLKYTKEFAQHPAIYRDHSAASRNSGAGSTSRGA